MAYNDFGPYALVWQIIIMNAITTVSYTHLDVYKRQLTNQLATAQFIRRELGGKEMNQPLPTNSGIANVNIEKMCIRDSPCPRLSAARCRFPLEYRFLRFPDYDGCNSAVPSSGLS